jgi:hypothetical protein
MSALDRLLPTPRLLEVDHVDLAASPETIWQLVRHGDIGHSAIARALFALREVPARLSGHRPEQGSLRIDALVSTAARPGFQVLVDDPPREVALGAIGKVWQLDIPFVHVRDAAEFAAFDEADYVKVAWAISVEPWGEDGARLTFEVRVDATDEEALAKFRRYFRLIGPASRFIRRSALRAFAKKLGTPEQRESERALPGDELISDVRADFDHGVTIEATPSQIWPWLVQMGCRRAGYYSIDALDNGGARSAREVHPELQSIQVGDVLPARPEGDGGFEVLLIDPDRALVLGGLWDADTSRQLRFRDPRPSRYSQVTWAFVLEALDARSTRLHVRVRAAYPERVSIRAALIAPVHDLMETAQLEHLKARVEGTLPRDDARDVLAGITGVAHMVLALATPFLRSARNHWGIDPETAGRSLPGDDLVSDARWGWTHGIAIEAPVGEVWPWIAQIGATKAGFYSYQWLENVVGCNLRNAEIVRPEWEVRLGEQVFLHPNMPPLEVARAEPGRWFVLSACPDEVARSAGRPWAAASWLFYLEPLGANRCRFISRYRVASSDDLGTRLSFGPVFSEPIGFAMDRRMLLGVKALAERPAGDKATGRTTTPRETTRGGAA